jgi:hypothetical protein
MIDDALLAAMKLRLAMTTPGPFIMTGGEDIYLTGATADDQEFIAHARQDIALLIDEIERLRAGHVGG